MRLRKVGEESVARGGCPSREMQITDIPSVSLHYDREKEAQFNGSSMAMKLPSKFVLGVIFDSLDEEAIGNLDSSCLNPHEAPLPHRPASQNRQGTLLVLLRFDPGPGAVIEAIVEPCPLRRGLDSVAVSLKLSRGGCDIWAAADSQCGLETGKG